MPPTAQDLNDNDAGRAEAAGRMLLDTAPLANPFVGLRPFESEEALLFFGRDEQTTELMQQLHLTRFLAVVGGSGCGKSSLIRAGLIPKLKAGFLLADRGDWRVATMKPGKAPLQNLAAALLSAFDEDPAGGALRPLVEEIEASGAEAVTEYVSRRLGGEAANVLLLVDQFEEIFRFGAFTDEDPNDDPDEREGRRAEAADFVSIMLGLTRGEAVPVYVVMTMRSDFLGDCDAFHGLPQAMNRSQYLVPRLTRQQRLEAIQCPVRLCRKRISPELSVRVLDDMGEDPDQLPVMQHALMRTFDKSLEEERINPRRDEGPGHYDMRVEHYEAVGTIKAALSKDADEALAGMTPEELIVTERMFQALVETDAKERRVRRPVHMSEVEAITGAARPQIENIIARLRGNNRSFLALSEDRLHGDPLIDISHESLIRQWETLRGWVKDEVKSREQYLRLAKDAALYYDPEKPKVALWRDPALQLALDWWDERRPNETWARRYHEGFAPAREFLDASLDNRAREEAEVAEAQRRELDTVQKIAAQRARTNQLLVAATVILAFLLLVAGGGVVYAFRAQREAKQSEQRARESEQRARESEQKALASEKEALANATAKEMVNKKLDASARALKEGEAEQKRLKDEAIAQAGEATRLKEAAEKNAAEALRAREKAAKANQALQLTLDTLSGEKLRREANKEQEKNNVPEARTAYIAAIDNFEKAGDHDGAAFTRVELGRMLLGQPNSDKQKEGLDVYRAAVGIYRKHSDFKAAAVTYDKIGDFYFPGSGEHAPSNDEETKPLLSGMSTAERTKLAVQDLCEALRDYEKASSSDGRIEVLTKLGNLLEHAEGKKRQQPEDADEATPAQAVTGVAGCQGRGARAVDYFSATVPLYEGMLIQQASDKEQVNNLRERLFKMLIRVSELQQMQKDITSAHANLAKAANIYKGDGEKEVKSLLDVGDAADDLPTRDQYYRRAVASGKTETLETVGNRLYSFGRILLVKESPDWKEAFRKSSEYYEEASKIHAANKEPEFQGRALIGSARSTASQGEPDAALKKYEEAVRLLPEVGPVMHIRADRQAALPTRQRGDAYLAIGGIQKLKGQTAQAAESYQRAQKAYEVAKYETGRRNALRALASLRSNDPEDTPATEQQVPGVPGATAPIVKVDIEARLTGAPIGGREPEGQANFEVERNGDRELRVEVEDIELRAGTQLAVFIDGRQAGTITLGPDRQGKLKLESSERQTIPTIRPNSSVIVKDAAGRNIVTGSFPAASAPAPSPTPL